MKESVKMKSEELEEMFDGFMERLQEWEESTGLESKEVHSLVITVSTLFLAKILVSHAKGDLLDELVHTVKCGLTGAVNVVKTIEGLKEEHGVQ